MAESRDDQIISRVQDWVERERSFSLFRCPSEIFTAIRGALQSRFPQIQIAKSVSELSEPPAQALLIHLKAADARRDPKVLYNWLVRAVKWMRVPLFLTSPDPMDHWNHAHSPGLWKGDGEIDWSDLYFEQLLPLMRWDSLSFPDLNEVHHADSTRFMTYIEKQLAEAMDALRLDYQPQAKIDRYHVDLLVRGNGAAVVVECDGAPYHSSEEAKRRDAERDRRLNGMGFRVLRFTGNEIVNDATACAKIVQRALAKEVQRSKRVDLDELDDSQRRAVQLPFKAARILAPAGSGKTRILINRGVHLANEGFLPRRVLALAFNKEAKDEMKARLKNKGIENIEVRTFHSFGLSLLRDVGIMFNENLEYVEGSDAYLDRLYNLLQSVGVEPSRDRTAPERFRAVIRRIKDNLEAPGPILDDVCRRSDGFRIRVEEFHRPKWSEAFEKFLEWQIKSGSLTFTDMIYLAVRKLAEDSELRRKYQGKYDAILVDEFQDLNAGQHALIRILAAPHTHLFVVGDDDQTIYTWRGAQIEPILEFPNRYPGSEAITLSTNYRCTKKIIHHADWLISHNENREKKEVQPAPNASEGLVEHIIEDSITAEADAVVKKLREAHDNGFSWNELAILSRYKEPFFAITSALRRAVIPYKCQDEPDFFSSLAVKAFRGYLSAVLQWPNPPCHVWQDILNVPNRYLSNDFKERARSAEAPIPFLKEAGGLSSDQRERIKELLTTLQDLHEYYTGASTTTFELLEKIDTRFSIRSYFKATRKSKGPQQTDAEHESNTMLSIDSLMEIASQHANPHEFLSYCEEQRHLKRDSSDNSDGGDKVQIMTIHSAKGKEWRGVVLFHLEDKDHPADDGEKQRDVEEERRVIYVGATRACEALWVTAKRGSESQFFKELFVTPEYVTDAGRLARDLQQYREKLEQLESEHAALEGELEWLESQVQEDLENEEITPDMLGDEEFLRTIERKTAGRLDGLQRHLDLLQRLFWRIGLKSKRGRQLEMILRFLRRKLEYIDRKKQLHVTEAKVSQLEEQRRLLNSS